MGMHGARWKAISHSEYAWEREALEFIRKRLPDREPYRAWANFEFIADDGSINEVDLLVLTPAGFFIIEIKSRSGKLIGDACAWTWMNEGRRYTDDNPLFGVNRKAKKLISLLKQQKNARHIRLPFLDALVFCSAPNLSALMQWTANRDHAARWQGAGQPFRDAAAAWIRQSAGRTSGAILRCISKNREPLALPAGIALGVIHHPSAGGALDKAAGRIEQLTGNAEIEPEAAQRWSAAALEVARRGFPREKERRLWLDRADDLLETVGAGSHAHLSDVSPTGL